VRVGRGFGIDEIDAYGVEIADPDLPRPLPIGHHATQIVEVSAPHGVPHDREVLREQCPHRRGEIGEPDHPHEPAVDELVIGPDPCPAALHAGIDDGAFLGRLDQAERDNLIDAATLQMPPLPVERVAGAEQGHAIRPGFATLPFGQIELLPPVFGRTVLR
jgi:hypothetical protein